MTENISDWAIRPLKGFGQLDFGMTADQVAAYNEIYGEVTSERDGPGSVEDFIQVLRQFGTRPLEEYDELIQSYREDLETAVAYESQTRKKFGLELLYIDSVLDDITLIALKYKP